MLSRAFLLDLFNLIGFQYVVRKCQSSNVKMFGCLLFFFVFLFFSFSFVLIRFVFREGFLILLSFTLLIKSLLNT